MGFVALYVAALLVVGVYVHSSWSYGKSLDSVPGAVDFQNRLADAFLAGQVSLKIEPPCGSSSSATRTTMGSNAPAGFVSMTLPLRGKLYCCRPEFRAVALHPRPRAPCREPLTDSRLLIFCLLGFGCSVAAFWILRRALIGRSTLAVALVTIPRSSAPRNSC